MPRLSPADALRAAETALRSHPDSERFDPESGQLLAYDRPAAWGRTALVAFVQHPLYPVAHGAVLVMQVALESGEVSVVRSAAAA